MVRETIQEDALVPAVQIDRHLSFQSCSMTSSSIPVRKDEWIDMWKSWSHPKSKHRAGRGPAATSGGDDSNDCIAWSYQRLHIHRDFATITYPSWIWIPSSSSTEFLNQTEESAMSSSDSATRSLPVLSLRAAEIASAAAQKKAQEIGIGVSLFEHDIQTVKKTSH